MAQNETHVNISPDDPSTRTFEPDKRRRKASELSQGPGLLDMVAGDDPDDDADQLPPATSSSVIEFYPDWCKCCKCCMSTERHAESKMSIKRHCTDLFECPPRGTTGRVLVFTFLFFSFWGMLYYLLKPIGEHEIPERGNPTDIQYKKYWNPAWVYGPIFALMIIEVTGLFLGVLLKRFFNFPALLGPLVLGIIYNNVPELNVFHYMKGFDYRECLPHPAGEFCEKMAKHTINNWVKPIRMIALGIILTRAGIELSPKQLKKLSGIVPLLAFGPCVVEACACAGLNYLFFNYMEPVEAEKMGVAMCFVGGFALAAVSPAVVVPGALSLKRTGHGVEKGVPTLLIAASSIDDVLAISIYTIMLGVAVPGGEFQKWQIFSGGCLGIFIGLAHGIIMGIILHFIPPQNSKNKPQQRILLLLMLNFISVLAYEEQWFNSAGSVCILTTSFIAGFGWRSQPHWKHPMHKIEGWLAHIWVLWVPLIFGTIGKEINFSGETFRGVVLGKTFGVIFIALAFRLLAAYLVVGCGTGFNKKERLFIALSWIPKATVQAALAPLVLTRVVEANEDKPVRGPEEEALLTNATIVVNVAILAVLITAPTGCILMSLTGPRLLVKLQTPHDLIEEEFPNGEGFDPAESAYGFDPARPRLASSSTQSIVSQDNVGLAARAEETGVKASAATGIKQTTK